MNWYVLQVLTGRERDVCEALRRKGVRARAPAQRMDIRRRGQWQTEERLLLPGYVFVGAEYTAALFHVVSPVSGVIRWLGLHCGEPQALDTRETLRWRLDIEETLEPSRVLFHADGTWHVLDGPLAAFAGCPVRMERRKRRSYVTAELGGVARRVRFGVIPVMEGSGP
nr:MAG TPA_asm: hypothetical protein [Caudoviricetes sp.]